MTVEQRRKKLIEYLGGHCVVCHSTKNLQFDHKEPRHWHPENLSRAKRMGVYERAARLGRIQLLCADDHAVKSANEGKGFIPRVIAHLFGPDYSARHDPF
jgi:hypothetical protein